MVFAILLSMITIRERNVMMKKLALLLCFTLLLALGGCGSSADTEAGNVNSGAENAGGENADSQGAEDVMSDGEASGTVEDAGTESEEVSQELSLAMMMESDFILPKEYIVEDERDLPATFINEVYDAVLNAWKNLDGEMLMQLADLSLEEEPSQQDIMRVEYYGKLCNTVLENAEYKAFWDETVGRIYFFPNNDRADMGDVLYRDSWYFADRIRQDCYNGELVVEQEKRNEISNEDALALFNRYRNESVYRHSLIDIRDFMEIDADTGKLSLKLTQPIFDSKLTIEVVSYNGYQNLLAGLFLGDEDYFNKKPNMEEGSKLTQEMLDAFLRKDVTWFYENMIVPSTTLDEQWKADFDKYLGDAESRAQIQSILDENCISLVTMNVWFKFPEKENASTQAQETLDFFKENNIVVYDLFNYGNLPNPDDRDYEEEFEEKMVYWLRYIIRELISENYLNA